MIPEHHRSRLVIIGLIAVFFAIAEFYTVIRNNVPSIQIELRIESDSLGEGTLGYKESGWEDHDVQA